MIGKCRCASATIILLVVACACSHGRPAGLLPVECPRSDVARVPPRSGQTFTFIAQGRPDSSLEGRFEGTAMLESNWISVLVPRAMVTIPPGDAENWRNLTVRAFLATDFCMGNWKAVAQARPVNVFRFIDFARTKPSERRTVAVEEPLKFLVPIPAGASLANSRLAFELEWVIVFGRYGDTESRFAFSGPLETGRP